MSAEVELRRRLQRAQRVALVLGGACVALIAAFVFLVTRDGGSEAGPIAQLDPEVREAAVERLTEQSLGIWDAWPDPDVGRILQPKKETVQGEHDVHTNELGLRERSFVWKKPGNVLRIVLLGDSYVYGQGIAADQRVGVHLERMLTERIEGRRVECLHFGLSSWNLHASAAFLRRQLSIVRPDLVIHVLVGNDLDDGAGVRGMGVPANFAPAHRERTDAMIWRNYSQEVLRSRNKNWLIDGLDHESRRRYADGALTLQRLAAAVEGIGGRYLVASNWPTSSASVARERLFHPLRPEQVLYLSSNRFRNPDYRISPSDAHWNAAGCENVATILYGILRQRELLNVALPEWPEAEQLATAIEQAGQRVADKQPPAPADLPIGPDIEPDRWNDAMRAQVYGGIDRDALVSPAASVILRGGGTEITLRGVALDRGGFQDATLTVLVEGEVCGSLTLPTRGAIDARFSLSPTLQERDFVTVELLTDDYVYDEQDPRHCVSFQLERLALE